MDNVMYLKLKKIDSFFQSRF